MKLSVDLSCRIGDRLVKTRDDRTIEAEENPMRISFRTKIIILVAAVAVVAGSALATTVYFALSGYFNRESQKSLGIQAAGVDDHMEQMKERCRLSAAFVAARPDIALDVMSGNNGNLMKYAKSVMANYGMEIITITDKDGKVLVRGHSDMAGDNIRTQAGVRSALNGTAGMGIESGTASGFSVRACSPIRIDNRIVGVVVAGFSLTNENKVVDRIKSIMDIECTFFQDDKRVSTTIMKDGNRAVGTRMDNPEVIDTVLKKGNKFFKVNTILGQDYNTVYWPLKDSEGATTGMLFIGQSRRHIADAYHTIFSYILVITLIVSVVMIIPGALFARNVNDIIKSLHSEFRTLKEAAVNGNLSLRGSPERIKEGFDEFREVIVGANEILDAVVTPLKESAEIMERIGRGDIPETVTTEYRGDFDAIKGSINRCISNIHALITDAGELSQAALEGRLSARADASRHSGDFRRIIEGVNATLDAVVEPMRESSCCLEMLAKGNFGVRVEGDYQGDHALIKNALNSTVDSINNTLFQVKEAVTQVNAGASQVADSSMSLSQGATEQAASLEEIGSSMVELASQTRTNAENAAQANKLTVGARSAAEQGAQQMNRMVVAMQEIDDASRSIAKIIKVIDDIAFQTNLLALNAAVEAARAGRHGKGFAVVAEEVRNLAGRSAKAAMETNELIAGSVRKVGNGMEIADRSAEALKDIVSSATKAADLVGEIAAASNEQAQGIAQVNQGLGQIDSVTQQNTANAEETASASEELSAQAAHLSRTLAGFRLAGEGTALVPSGERHTRKAALPPISKPAFTVRTADRVVRPEEIIALDDSEFGRY